MIDFAALSGSPFLEALLVAALAAYSQYVVLRAGIFSVATVGFMSIGAFTMAILRVNHHVPTVIAVAAAIVVSAVVGTVLGRLIGKLRGAYQAIATFAFVMILQEVFLQWKSLTGGFEGIAGIPLWANDSSLIPIFVVVLLAVIALELSSLGREQQAIFFDELAAASCGTNVAGVNLAVMTVSGGLGGLAGAAMAGNQYAIDPTAFNFDLVIVTLSAVIIGGYRSFWGPLFGSYVSVALPLLFSSYQVLSSTIDAVATILILLCAPRGIAWYVPVDAERLGRLLRRVRQRRRAAAPHGTLVPGEGHEGGHTGKDCLTVHEIARAYGSVKAVDGISLEVCPSQVVGLIGPNGAGKTSVINLIAGVTALNAGQISIGDDRIDELPAYLVERHGLARTFQTCRLFPESTAFENVLYGAMAGRSRARRRTLSDNDCARAAMELADCLPLTDRIAGDLPYSHQRHVELARALAAEPRFLLLDEPAAGMTESEADRLGDVIRAVAKLGIGVLVVDHNVPWICAICDVVSVQHLGQIISSGSPETVRRDPLVIEAYIGTRSSETEVPEHVDG